MLTIRRRGDGHRGTVRLLEGIGPVQPGLRSEERVGDTSTGLPRRSRSGMGARIRAAAIGGVVVEAWGTTVSA